MRQKFLLKTMLLLCMMMVGVGTAWADTETITLSEQGYKNAEQVSSTSGTVVTLTYTDGGTATAYYNTGTGVRVYSGGKMTVTAGDNTITKVVVTFAKNNNPTISFSSNGTTTTSSTDSPATWEGSATAVDFNVSSKGHARIQTVAVTYTTGGGGSTLQESDFALTNVPIALTFDLYNNSSAQTINYTTSSSGAVTVSASAYVETEVNETAKTITVTPKKITNGAQEITVSQAADATYKSGNATFTVTITDNTPFDGEIFDATKDKGDGSITKGDVTFTCNNGVLNNESEYRLYKNSETTFSTTSGKITKIEFTQSGNYAISNLSPSVGTLNDGIWEGSATSVTFTASGGQARASIIKVTVESDQAGENQVATPVITVNDGLFFDTKTVTITCATNGAAIQYSTDDGTTWNNYSAPFTIDETTTVKAKATMDGMTESKVATETFTKVEVLEGLAAFNAKGNGTYYVNLTNTQVTYKGIYTSSNNNQTPIGFMEDATAGIYLYGPDPAINTLYNGIYQLKMNVYNDLPELTEIVEVEATTTTADADKVASEIELATLTANWTENMGRKLKLSKVLINNILFLTEDVYLSDNTGTIDDENGEGRTYDLIGYAYLNKGKKEFMVVEATEVAGAPAIVLEETGVDIDAAGGDGTIGVTYKNITTVVAEVKFYESDGTTPATYNWISAEIDDNHNVYYLVDGNDGEERTAYMKVYALDDDAQDVYSELITVTQAEYVAPEPIIGNFVKVTSTDDLTSGQYLIVYEDGNVAFDGSLTTLDASENTIGVTIENGEIAATTTNVKSVFNIDVTAGTLQSASGKYIGVSSNSNGLKTSDDATAYTNTFSIDEEENADIKAVFSGSSMTLRYNHASNQARFRYYKDYGQQPIQLYKFVADAEDVEVTVTAAGYATYCSTSDLDFSATNLKAYKATITGTEVKFTEVKQVPAGQGVLLKGVKGEEKTYSVPVAANAAALTGNAFIGVTEVTPDVPAGIFVLMNGEKGVGFYKTTSAFTVGANTAYLPSLGEGARTFIGFDNETTAIERVAAESMANGEVYNLQGQRVVAPQKGLYIVNGKKVLVK